MWHYLLYQYFFSHVITVLFRPFYYCFHAPYPQCGCLERHFRISTWWKILLLLFSSLLLRFPGTSPAAGLLGKTIKNLCLINEYYCCFSFLILSLCFLSLFFFIIITVSLHLPLQCGYFKRHRPEHRAHIADDAQPLNPPNGHNGHPYNPYSRPFYPGDEALWLGSCGVLDKWRNLFMESKKECENEFFFFFYWYYYHYH